MKKVVFIILFIIFFQTSIFAAESVMIPGEEIYNDAVSSVADGNMDLNPVQIVNVLIKSVFSEISETEEILKSILLIATASGLLRILSDSFGNSGSGEAAFFVCFLLMAVSCVEIFSKTVGYGVEIIHTLCEFITKFEPLFIGLLVSCGAVTQAAAFQPVITAGVFILTLVIDKCILPLTYFSATLAIVNNIGNRIEIGTLNNLIKSASKWLLTGVLTLFSAVLTIYGFGTSAFNAVTSRGIKFAVGSFVPVVGGLLSDTVDTVLTGTNLLKNSVGTAGMIAVISIVFVPVVKIWVMMMLLKITAAVIEPFSDKRITNLMLAVSDAVSMVFSMVITAGMLFVISIGIILASTGVTV